MEWIHSILAVAIYIKIIVLIYYVLKYLTYLQNRGFQQQKVKK